VVLAIDHAHLSYVVADLMRSLYEAEGLEEDKLAILEWAF
jgi:hypothetical protein